MKYKEPLTAADIAEMYKNHKISPELEQALNDFENLALQPTMDAIEKALVNLGFAKQ